MPWLIHLRFMQAFPVETWHVVLEFTTPIFLGLVAYVGLLIKASLGDIKLEQSDAKAALLANQTEIKEDLTRKHSENTKAIEVHAKEDEGHFREIAASLTRGEETMRRGEETMRRIEARQINGTK
jgi:hypothetical protein